MKKQTALPQHSFDFPESKNASSEKAPSNARGPFPRVDYDLPQDPKSWSGIALIGEAPGAEEVRLGHPFVGRSGQLLDKILKRAEIDRTQCLVANVFRFQPPGNKVDHFFISKRAANAGGIGIAEEWGRFGSAFCRAEFAGEIENLRQSFIRLRPKIVIGLGRTPLWALTGESGLLEKVGKPLPNRLLPGGTVIPTYHPSFILRGNWGLQDNWLAHLETAKSYIS
jgi:DNA polymerase